jgi:L-ascorbate metabolism protein UlaG (beta-lactamase superfamily)
MKNLLSAVMILSAAVSGLALTACVPAGGASALVDRLVWLESRHRYGSACIRFEENGKLFYIDPSFLKNPEQPPADFILLTHNHDDHLDPAQLARLVKPGTVIVGPASCAPENWPQPQRLAGLDYRTVTAGETLVIGGVTLKTFPAYNPGDDSVAHPRSSGGTGYLLTLTDKTRMYLTGDTSYVPELDAVGRCDVVVAAWSTTCMMGPADVLACAGSMKPAFLIPVHWLPYEKGELLALEKKLPRGVKLWLPEYGG